MITKVVGAVALGLVGLMTLAARAETPVERYVEVRTALGFRLPPEAFNRSCRRAGSPRLSRAPTKGSI